MKVILSFWQVTRIIGDSGTPDPLMESWSGLPTEGPSTHITGSGDTAATTDARDRGRRSPDDYDEFERQTREGVRVLDEMSDEDDSGGMDEAGGGRETHKDVQTVTLEPLGSSLEKTMEKIT